MTIDEIASEIRKHTYGLLNDGEVAYTVELALQSHGGIDPEDIQKVKVVFEENRLDVRFLVNPVPEFIQVNGLASP